MIVEIIAVSGAAVGFARGWSKYRKANPKVKRRKDGRPDLKSVKEPEES
jgi:hypothetical protein